MPYTKPAPGDEVVITGIAGRYPSCQNINELKEKIMNKEDLITDVTRWPKEINGLPPRLGQIPIISKFDAVFFGVHTRQISTMDPMSRSLMELTYEAIVDAGRNPIELRGKKVAVVIGVSFSESERMLVEDRGKLSSGFVVTGCSRAMVSNRITYWLGVHGPSYTVDAACSSSAFALDQAYRMIMSGECEEAIVGGSNLCIHPYVTMHFTHLGVLSMDGRCKSFDADADGYVRSDGLCVVYLQKAKDAKRIYTTVVHTKTNSDGYKSDGITFPSRKLQMQLLADFYEECKVSPNELNYLEAHGTGTKIGDPEEIYAVDATLCRDRTKPLKIGSVKSNLGHSEATSCLCSLSKVIIAMETGIIPPNINYKRPRECLTGIIEGRMEVVTEKTPWELGYAALNSFGFGGANAHILLKSHTKEKVNDGAPNDDLPRVVVVSGRTKDAVDSLLNTVESVDVDVEYIRLLHDVFAYNTQHHSCRGYTIVNNGAPGKIREIVAFNESARPIWFVFSGMGSQWPGMGKMLMRFSVFAKAIEKCDAVLRPRGIDILHIISTDDENIVNNILNCFVGIAAIQIGLVDLLTAVGIVPDNIIGHSVGELGCAYADGCFTAEQMILAAYARGRASIESDLIHGAMAAIGMGAQIIEQMCPPDIDVACHNSSNSSTISGPSASIKSFVAKLTERKIFARTVATGNIAYHSRYIAEAGPKLLAALKEIMPEPKARSDKWLSSSVPEKDWSTEAAKYSSAEYHTNNLLSAVLFEETTKHIPKNAICIEIAPHGLLQAILKRSLSPEASNVSLTLRGHQDNAAFFAQALGKLYNLGLQPKVANIYPAVSFPVSRGTPMISPHLKWDHSIDWYIAYFDDKEKIASGERALALSTRHHGFEYLTGHVVDGRNLLPASGYIFLVWDTIAQMTNIDRKSFAIVFNDIRFVRAVTLPQDETKLPLTIMINKGTGYFEVLDNDVAVVTGTAHTTLTPAAEMISGDYLPQLPGEEVLNTRDIYKGLKIRGYDYQGIFQSIKSASIDGTKGHVAWLDNYVAFIDNMLQLKILGLKNKSLYVPTSIRKLVIDPKAHEGMAAAMKADEKEFPVYIYDNLSLIMSGGIQVLGLSARSVSRRKLDGIPVLQEYKFVAHRDRAETSLEEMIILSCEFALDAQPTTGVKALEVVDDDDNIPTEDLASPMLLRHLQALPLVKPVAYIATSQKKYKAELNSPEIQFLDTESLPGDSSIYITIGRNLLSKKKDRQLKGILSSLRAGGFILTAEDLMDDATLRQASRSSLDIIMEKCSGSKTLLLLRKHPEDPEKLAVVSVSSKGLDWLEKVKEILKNTSETETKTRLLLVTQADKECGILGMVNCLRKEPGGEIVSAVIIEDEDTPRFSPGNSFFTQQLQLGLPVNILKGGAWGSYRHLPLPAQQPRLSYHAYINQVTSGDLSSLRWTEGPIKPTDRPHEQFHAVYIPLNFKDLMVTTGRIPVEVIYQPESTSGYDSLIGIEFSGVSSRGERVMGLLKTTSMTNIYYPETSVIWKVPDHWSLEEAATVPVVYLTVCYAFYVLDKIKKGEKILIHSGTGGIGQAAIHLALQEGLEVFTTVGRPEKRQFIREKFPSIPEDHIGNSRDVSFEAMIMRATNGRGVDIVLNSLAEDKLLASVRCLAHYGRFFEIGKYDIAQNNPLNMHLFLKEISFRSIMLDYTLVTNSSEKLKSMTTLIDDFLAQGKIAPINRTVFGKDEIEAAMRHMVSGKHTGKVLIKVCEENGPCNKPILAYPRFYCTTSGSYIIFGGLGGLGLEVAEWLCSRRARHLVLVSRRGITTGYQKLKIHQWRADGTTVQVIAGKEAWKREDCEYILKTAAKIAPVDGIFNLAVQLRDAVLVNQTVEAFEESLRPKVGITQQLDQLSRTLCPELRYFVVFSSVSCGRGTAGQTNYGFGNAAMERICERRVAEGLPGLAIQWGAVGEVGLVADMQKDNKEINIGGTLQQKVSSILQEMERFLLQSHPVVSSMVVAEKKTVGFSDPLQEVLNLMGVKNIESVNKEIPLVDLGMDSMLAIEIKETLEREFNVFLTAAEMRSLNYRKLIALSKDKNSDGVKLDRGSTAIESSEEQDDMVWIAADIVTVLSTVVQNTAVCVDFPVVSDQSGSRVFLIPGLSGDTKVFSTLVSNLKHSVTCVQFPNSETCASTISLVEYLLPYIIEKLDDACQATLVGYSMGSFVAIEIVKRLERLGKKCRIILIDGTPAILKSVTGQYDTSNTESVIHNRVLSFIAKKAFPMEAAQYEKLFETFNSLDEKVQILVPKLNIPGVPLDYQKAVIMGTCIRAYAGRSYEFDESDHLESPITLIKAAQGFATLCNCGHGLENVTKGAIEEFSVEGNHATILHRKELASLINRLLVNA